jgi:hypothetical protein
MPYEIVQLNFKKREFTGKPLRSKRNTYQSVYSPYTQNQNLNEIIQVVKLKSAHNSAYYPQPSLKDKKLIVLIDTKSFYQLEDEMFKEKYYERHLKTCYRDDDFAPIRLFTYRDDGKLTIRNSEAYVTDENGKPVQPLNPFKESDREKMAAALKKGIAFDNEYRQEAYLETIGGTLPEISRLIEKSMAGLGQEVAEADPLPKENTPENFRENLIDLGKRPRYRNDVMAAAQYLIRTAEPSDKEHLKTKLVSLGCVDPESTRKILASWIREPPVSHGITPRDPGMGR